MSRLHLFFCCGELLSSTSLILLIVCLFQPLTAWGFERPHLTVDGVFCDDQGRALIHSVSITALQADGACGSVEGFGEVAVLRLNGCGYLAKSVVQQVATDATSITLKDVGRGSVISTADEILQALRDGTSWQHLQSNMKRCGCRRVIMSGVST